MSEGVAAAEVAAPRAPVQVLGALLQLGAGYGLAIGVSVLLGRDFRRAAFSWFDDTFASWPCALLLVLWGAAVVLAVPMAIVCVTRPFADKVLPHGLCVFVGAAVGTWAAPGSFVDGGVAPGMAVSLLIAIATAVEVRVRAMPWHRVTVLSMFAAVVAQLLLVAGVTALNAME
ncbi:MAG: hypothetical protein H6835_10855 [Planctomycetes bacterium]|nr:hypothetical protein [Planctomycetota bacterium]